MCDARIRPFPNDTEIVCELEIHPQNDHKGSLRNYAYPGSLTVIQWSDKDRRNFHGEWPGRCGDTSDNKLCSLPVTHYGRCVD